MWLVRERYETYLFRGYAFAEQRVSGPCGVHDDLIGERAFETPVVPIFFRRRVPFVFDSGVLVKLGDESFIRWAEINLAEHRPPPPRARKLEDLCGCIAIGKNGVNAVVMIARELGDCLTLKPFVSTADQLPAILACERRFQLECERGNVWSDDLCVRELRVEPVGKTVPKIGDEFAEQAVELQRARDGVMLARTELAAEPGLHLWISQKSFPQRRKGAKEDVNKLSKLCASLCAFAPLRENFFTDSMTLVRGAAPNRSAPRAC